MSLTRRTFVKKSLATIGLASTFAISGSRASGQVLGANDRVRVGVIGLKSRGAAHIKEYASMPNVEVAYLIDADTTLHSGRAADVEKKYGNKPACVQDPRKALEDKNLNAISIATSNHTHSLFTIWGAQAGKDV